MSIINNNDQKLEKLNIVYLEDMPDIRRQMIKDLREIGCKGSILELDTVAKALAFLKQPQKQNVSLFISDWNLPDGIGIDFLKATKATAHYKNIPFLMCTTMDEISNILLAVENGANDYIVKPWEQHELKNKILTSI